jgi:hypothetical protein
MNQQEPDKKFDNNSKGIYYTLASSNRCIEVWAS